MIQKYVEYKKSKQIVEEFESSNDSNSIDRLENFIEYDLSPLEKRILKEYYFDNKSLKKIAKEMNFSYSHIQGTHMHLKTKLTIAIKSFGLK